MREKKKKKRGQREVDLAHVITSILVISLRDTTKPNTVIQQLMLGNICSTTVFAFGLLNLLRVVTR